MMKNYWKLKDYSLFSVPYAYVDHSSYLADQLFIDQKVRVKFKGEMMRENSPYCVVFCRVRKKDTIKFEEALDKLENKMLLFGYTDYAGVCGEIQEMIDGGTEGEKREKVAVCE